MSKWDSMDFFEEKLIQEAYLREWQKLDEVFKKSYDINVCVEQVQHHQPFSGNCAIRGKYNRNRFFLLCFGQQIEAFDIILKVMENRLGWFPTQMRIIGSNDTILDLNGAKKAEKGNEIYSGKFNREEVKRFFDIWKTLIVSFWMERKFPTAIEEYKKEEINVNDLPQFIYHTTFKTYEQKIKKYGLIPKSKNKIYEYPERIYFALNELDAKKMKVLPGSNRIRLPKDTSLNGKILITVDTTKLPKFMKRPNMPDRELNWYHDPQSVRNIFTTDNIPKESIINIEVI